MLDDLVDLIAALKTRIRNHGGTLRENETRTRMALVDPLLCALGWDTGNPDLVGAEYSVRRARADYALLGNEEPVAIVEAKRLGEPLDDQHLNQMLSYANQLGIPKAAITDGDHWQLYEVFKRAPLAERVILSVRVADEQPVQCAMRLLALWRRNLSAGNSVVLPPNPQQESGIKHPALEGADSHNGTLADFNAGSDEPPRRIAFPGESAIDLPNQKALLREVAEYLVRNNRLTRRNGTFESGPQRYIVHSSPTHKNDNPFSSPVPLPNGLYLETGNAFAQTIEYAKRLLRHCEMDARQVRLLP